MKKLILKTTLLLAAALGLPMAAVGGGAALGQSTTTGTQNPGLFDYLSSFANILGGLGGR